MLTEILTVDPGSHTKFGGDAEDSLGLGEDEDKEDDDDDEEEDDDDEDFFSAACIGNTIKADAIATDRTGLQ